MITRNDDPPDDPDTDRNEALEMALWDLLNTSKIAESLLAFVMKVRNDAYTEGYNEGRGDEAEAIRNEVAQGRFP